MKYKLLTLVLAAFAFLSACAIQQATVASPATQQGWRLEQQGELPGAIEAYSRAIQADPNDWLSYLRRGMVYMQQKSFDKAVPDFTQYCRLKPAISDSWATRANCFDQMGRFKEAVDDEDKALAIDDLPIYRFVRTKGLFQLGRYAEAAAEAEKILNIKDPGQSETVHLIHAGSLAYTNQSAKAVAAFDDFISRFHKAPYAPFLYPEGLARYQAGQLDRARQIAVQLRNADAVTNYRYDADHAVEMFNLDANRTRAAEAAAVAEKERSAGHLMEAFQAFSRAWLLAPGLTPEDGALRERISSSLHLLYAQMPEKPVLPEEARRLFVMAKASVRDATGPAAYQQALAYYNALLAITPWYPLAYYNAGLLRAGTGDYAMAVRDMRIYLQLEPNGEDARKVTDQIYEWEAKIR
jgi:tetratricopeptide (TPR) repeat protein